MNTLKATLTILIAFYSISSHAIRFDELTWITQDKGLKETLKDQVILKTFEAPQMCKATFCYDYVICSVDHDYLTDRTEFVETKISGSSIFFKKKLEFTAVKSERISSICQGN